MKKLILILALLIAPALTNAETISLSTYYPSPRGSYDTIKLVPRTALPTDCDIGSIFVLDTDNELQFCQDDGDADVTGEWKPVGGVWTEEADTVFLDDADFPNLKVGIGDSSPEAIFEISGSGGGLDDLFLVSDDDNDDGNFMTVKNDGKLGVGTNNPTSLVTIQDSGPTGDSAIFQVIDTNGVDVMFANDIGNIRFGDTVPGVLDNQVEVLGSLEVEDDGVESKLRFKSPGTFYSMGVDLADNKFKLNNGSNVGDNPHFVMDTNGDITIGGSLTVKNNGVDTGEVKVNYVGGVSPGYYATYAP